MSPILLNMVVPLAGRQLEHAFSDRFQTRADCVALAAELYRNDHFTYPSDLADLVPDYLPAVPLDPCTDQPLHYLPMDGDFSLWSVGKYLHEDRFRPPRDWVFQRSEVRLHAPPPEQPAPADAAGNGEIIITPVTPRP